LCLQAVERGAPPGVRIVLEGVPGIGKAFLARQVLGSGRRGEDHFGGRRARSAQRPVRRAAPLLAGLPGSEDSADAAFDRVDELCADGPVVLYADGAHNLDGPR
jgi:hypothetical protein